MRNALLIKAEVTFDLPSPLHPVTGSQRFCPTYQRGQDTVPRRKAVAFSPHPLSGKFCALFPGGMSQTAVQGLSYFNGGQSSAEAHRMGSPSHRVPVTEVGRLVGWQMAPQNTCLDRSPGRGGGRGHPSESFIYLELLSQADTLFRDWNKKPFTLLQLTI